MAVDFSNFTSATTIPASANFVGYDVNASGGEKKWTLSTVANAVSGIILPQLSQTPAITSTFKNKLINGNFDIWQRGTSLASGTGARYLADRWTNGSATTTYTSSQQTFILGQTDVPNEPEYFHRTVVTSGNTSTSNATLHQHIEDVRTFAGKTVTLSFYAKSPSAPKSVAVEFYQNFGTGGSPSTAVSIPAGLFVLTTSWQKFTVTANIPSIAGKTLGTDGNDCLTVYFWFDAGSNFASRASSLGNQSGTFDIALVQLEEGSIATPFELRHIGTELSLCQRYYWISKDAAAFWSGYAISGNDYYASILFPVTMRSNPTCPVNKIVFFAQSSNFNMGSMSVASNQSAYLQAFAAATVPESYWYFGASFDAEL